MIGPKGCDGKDLIVFSSPSESWEQNLEVHVSAVLIHCRTKEQEGTLWKQSKIGI
jgi:hypothetical protein